MPIAVCLSEVTARRLARGRYIQGSDGPVRAVELIKSGAFSHQNQATKNAIHGALCAAMLRVGDERHDALPHEIQIDFAVVVLGCHLFEGQARPLDVPLARQDVCRPD